MSKTGIFLTLLIVCGLIAIYSELSAKTGRKMAAKVKPKKTAAKPGQPGKPLLKKSAWSKDPEQFETTGGASFQEVFKEAARLALEKRQPVKFGFNRRPGEAQFMVLPNGKFELTN